MPKVMATSFADPMDVIRYNNAIKQGKTEAEALRVGDRGTGEWGQCTTRTDIPMCALPQAEWMKTWKNGFIAMGKTVAVTYNGKTVVGQLADTIPSPPKNGARIYLNPGFAKALGLNLPFTVQVTWAWGGPNGPHQFASIF